MVLSYSDALGYLSYIVDRREKSAIIKGIPLLAWLLLID